MKKKAERILPASFLKELRIIIKAHNKDAANGKDKRVGHLTQEKRQGVLEAGFADLFELNIKLGSAQNFKAKHLETLARHWEKNGQSPSTIQNKICIFRTFVNVWLNKPNVIQDSKDYVSNPDSVHREYIAQEDKSWESNGIDVEEKLREIYALDKYVGLQLRLEDAFGCRCREAIEFRPHVNYHRDAYGDHLDIYYGTKGGRSRIGWIRNEYQREVVEACVEFVRAKNGDMRRPGQSIEQAINRYYYILKKAGITRKQLGVTGHGLRVGFANDRYKEYAGVRSPVQGGKVGQVDRDTDTIARLKTSEDLGHKRIDITAAYFGSHGHEMRKAPKANPDIQGKQGEVPAFDRKHASTITQQQAAKQRLDWSGWGKTIQGEAVLKVQNNNEKEGENKS